MIPLQGAQAIVSPEVFESAVRARFLSIYGFHELLEPALKSQTPSLNTQARIASKLVEGYAKSGEQFSSQATQLCNLSMTRQA